MTKREFLEQKRLTDPVWYAQHVGFNANGELVDLNSAQLCGCKMTKLVNYDDNTECENCD